MLGPTQSPNFMPAACTWSDKYLNPCGNFERSSVYDPSPLPQSPLPRVDEPLYQEASR